MSLPIQVRLKNEVPTWSPLLFGLAIILIIISKPPWPITLIISGSIVLCMFSFGFTVLVSSRRFGKQRKDLINSKSDAIGVKLNMIKDDLRKMDGLKTIKDGLKLNEASTDILQNEKERLDSIQTTEEKAEAALIIGISAIYALVNSFGISESLVGYFETLSMNLNTELHSIIEAVKINYAYSFRLGGYLATIIPFIHGAIMTITTKWYHDPLSNIYHYRIAFLFFIAILVHTVPIFLPLGTELISYVTFSHDTVDNHGF